MSGQSFNRLVPVPIATVGHETDFGGIGHRRRGGLMSRDRAQWKPPVKVRRDMGTQSIARLR
jgi:hypothetical protein